MAPTTAKRHRHLSASCRCECLTRRQVEQMEADGVISGGAWTRTVAVVGPELPPGAPGRD
jgi:hypothetical protein